MKKTNLILLALLTLALTACGGGKVAKNPGDDNPLSSRDTDTIRTSGTTGVLADCNSFKYNSEQMSGIVSAFYQNGVVIPDKMNLRLISLPNEAITGTAHKIEMHLWGQENGSAPHDQTAPVEFKVQNVINGQYIKNADYTDKVYNHISKNVINEILAYYNSSWGMSYENVLQKHIFVLQGTQLQYDAINLALYPIEGGAPESNINFLLPQFFADPQIYANTHDSRQLQEIHPNYPNLNSGWSEDVYFEYTEQWCREFMKEVPQL